MSKNNFDERLRKMEPKKDHFSIRKFSVGVASVLIGFSFLGLANSQVIKADTTGEPQAVQAKQSVSASSQQKAVAQTSQKQLDQGNVPANNSQTKQTLTSIQAAAVQAMQKQQAAEIARQNSRLPEDQKPAKKIDAGVGLAGRKEVQGAVKNLADQIDKTASSDTQTVKDDSQKNPVVVVDKKDDTAKEAAVKPDLPTKQAADQKVKVDKKNQEYQTITLEDLSVSDQNALAKSLGMSLKQLQTEVASNTSGIVVPASEWLGDASWRYQTINMQTGVLKANTDTDLPFKIISKIKGGDVAHNRDYELRIQLDHRLDPYVAGIKVSQQGDVRDTNMLPQKSMTKNADGSWSLPLIRLDGGVIGLANVDYPYTNPHCDIIFKDQINNFYANLGDLKSNPLQYAIYGYDKKTGKVIGDYKSTGYIISQDSPFNMPVATGSDAEKPGSANQPYYQGAGLTIQYDKSSNTINALYNPDMLGEWFWDAGLGKDRIDKLNYVVDPRLVPYIGSIRLINYKPGDYPFDEDGKAANMKTVGKGEDLYIGRKANVGQGNIEVTKRNMKIDSPNINNHYVGIAYHLNKNLGEVIKDLSLEEKANSRLMFGVYFTAKNGKMAPNTLATSAFDIDKLGQADNYQPEYNPVIVTKGNNTAPAVSAISHLTWEDKNAPKDNPTYTAVSDPTDPYGKFILAPDSNGNILVTPTDKTSVGMHNMLVTVTYSDGTVDQVYVPIYVKDLNHDIHWVKDPNGKTTGAIEIVTGPKAHETSGNSQVLTPNNFVSEINQYKIAKDGKAVSAGAIDKSAAHITWTGHVLNTHVNTPTMTGKSITGSVIVDLSNVNGIDKILGNNSKIFREPIDFAPVGAVAQKGAYITISQNKQPTSDQLAQLINHSNLDGLPKSMAVDQYELKPGTTLKVGTNNVTIRIIFKDKDSQGNQTYLDVNVPAGVKVTTNTTDADQYQAVYGHKTAYVGDPVDFAKPNIQQKNGKNADSSLAVSYQAVSTTPAWAKINNDGTISISHAPAVGFYNIPVQVTYRDGSSNSAYAALTVINRNQKVNWDSNSSVSVYRSSVNKYHKTNDKSAHDTEITKDVPIIDQISWTNFETKDHQPETIVYVRQSDGSYKLVSGAGFKDANGDIAPATIAAGQITSVWKTGFEGNSDASNFPKTGTGTSLAKDQWNNPGAEQQEQTGKMAGNSKAIMLGHFGADAEKILGVKNSDDFWFNVYSNYYGAKATGAVQTFKQGQDISNLSQAQYRQLVDVTDLGQNGWNGTNINPDAPQVLAYVPGTNSGKKFYMTWAPGKEASTAKVANGVNGTVRIHFGDGTYLDLAVKINVKADKDSGKPDHDKSEFTQKIVYTYNGQEVAYTTIDNIPKDSNLSAETLKNAIDSNVPANYTIQTGYVYPAARNNITATPAIIYVPLTHNSDDSFNANGQIIYQTTDGKKVADGRKIASHLGDTLSAGLLKDWADEGMTENTLLKGYVIAQYPASYDVTSKKFTITVIVKAGTEVINPTNPKDPDQTDLFEDVTRTINVHNPNGTDDVTKQVVHFERNKTINAVTHEVISYGDWQLVAGSAKDWAAFTAPTIKGYTADPSSVAEKSVDPTTQNETVDIYYTKNNNGGGNNQPTQPSQPTQPNPVSTPQTSNPAPAQPTTPYPEPKPQPQPSNQNNGGQKSNPGTNNKPKATTNGNQGHHAQGGQNAGNKSGYAKQGTAKAGENGLNGNGLGQKASGNGNNGSEAAQSNVSGKGAKTLPQTGDKQNNASIFGLALASLAGLFGLAGDRKRNKR